MKSCTVEDSMWRMETRISHRDKKTAQTCEYRVLEIGDRARRPVIVKVAQIHKCGVGEVHRPIPTARHQGV